MARKIALKVNGLEDLLSTNYTERIIRTIQEDVSDVRNAYTIAELHTLSEKLSSILPQLRFSELKNTLSSEIAFRDGIEQKVKGDIFDQNQKNFVSDTLFYKLNDLSFGDWIKKVHLYVRYNLDSLSSQELFDIKETVKLAYQEIKSNDVRIHELKDAKTAYKSVVSTLSYYRKHRKVVDQKSVRKDGTLLYASSDSDVLFDMETHSSGNIASELEMNRKDILSYDAKKNLASVLAMQEKLLAKEQDDFEKYRREIDRKKETNENNKNRIVKKLQFEKETAKRTQRMFLRSIPKNYALVLSEHKEEVDSHTNDSFKNSSDLSNLSKGDYALTRGWNETRGWDSVLSANDDLELQDSAFYDSAFAYQSSDQSSNDLSSKQQFVFSSQKDREIKSDSSSIDSSDSFSSLDSLFFSEEKRAESVSKEKSFSSVIVKDSNKEGDEISISDDMSDAKTPVEEILAFEDVMEDAIEDSSDSLSSHLSRDPSIDVSANVSFDASHDDLFESMKGGPSEWELPQIGRSDAHLPIDVSELKNIPEHTQGGPSEYAMPKVDAHMPIRFPIEPTHIDAGLFGGGSETQIPKQVSSEREDLPLMKVSGKMPPPFLTDTLVPPPLPIPVTPLQKEEKVLPPPLPQVHQVPAVVPLVISVHRVKHLLAL